ncbi:MAG: phosphoribosylanthranilate isomerase [Ulvibacter sp.]|jgi:phosphoribosylanthranilate isomerase
MSGIKLKVCGMNLNTSEVASLRPDYLGFIFYNKSQRFFNGEIPVLSSGTSKVGVFVNASTEEISEKINKYKLDVVQLHGDETPEFCKRLIEHFQNESSEIESPALPVLPVLSGVEVSGVEVSRVEVWKVFGIRDSFNFELLEAYEDVVDKFLFDTKGKEKGGNGYTFNWEVLNEYRSKKPFILSGGIGLEEIEDLKKILNTKLPVYAIDVNSKFETEPGLKNITDLKKMKQRLKKISR